MIYLLLGEDLSLKDAKISQIKSSLFKNAQALNFDFDNLDANCLLADTLKKSLITLPVMSAKRLIVLRNIHKLKVSDIDVLIHFVQEPLDHADVILESSETSFKGELKSIENYCAVSVFAGEKPGNVFDMTKLIKSGRLKEAMLMLNSFYKQGSHPLQIMGALVWFWGKEGRVLSQEKFELGLHALEEADLSIKRSRLDPEYAVEKLIVELTGLLSSSSRR